MTIKSKCENYISIFKPNMYVRVKKTILNTKRRFGDCIEMKEMREKPYRIEYIAKWDNFVQLNGFEFDIRDIEVVEVKEKENKIFQFDESLLEI